MLVPALARKVATETSTHAYHLWNGDQFRGFVGDNGEDQVTRVGSGGRPGGTIPWTRQMATMSA